MLLTIQLRRCQPVGPSETRDQEDRYGSSMEQRVQQNVRESSVLLNGSTTGIQIEPGGRPENHKHEVLDDMQSMYRERDE